jgi:uncharacterized protein (DUF952 family)
MAFTLDEVVPWGRSFDEYVAMFALSDDDLARRILGMADGPASFNARLTKRGGSAISADPLYRWSAPQIRERIRDVTPTVLEQARANADGFIWTTHIRSLEELRRLRESAMDEFLGDYESADARVRYVDAALPALPFADAQFDLALCSHFLFLYSEQESLLFHVDAILELCRVAAEVRIFPLLELSGAPSRHVQPVLDALDARGMAARRQRVSYEFQRGGNEMLVISRADPDAPLIFHIAPAESWTEAQRRGTYTAGSLASEGFIHCSEASQVIGTANRLFRGRRGLVLLHVDEARLRAPVVRENLEGGERLFPHVYGALNLDAILRVTPFEPGDDGSFDHHLIIRDS